MKINPEEDGTTHINIYSRGKTTLGRLLSNWTPCNLVTDEGEFRSVEGYWFYLGTNHPDKNKLKYLVGYEAKKFGEELRKIDKIITPNFEDRIAKVIKYKIDNCLFASDRRDFYSSTLPFTHYYVYGTKVVEQREFQWIVNKIEDIRRNK